MTWEPTAAEAETYHDALTRHLRTPGRLPGDWQTPIMIGLRAAYAALEERVNAGDVLGRGLVPPLAELVRGPDVWEYRHVQDLDHLNEAGADGWRVEHVLPLADGQVLYILERPIDRPDRDAHGRAVLHHDGPCQHPGEVCDRFG